MNRKKLTGSVINLIDKMSDSDLEKLSGGSVSPSPFRIDDIFNGKNYNWLAEWIVNGGKERTRKVDNKKDIYDCDI